MRLEITGVKELQADMAEQSAAIARAFKNIKPEFLVRAQEILEVELEEAAAQAGPQAFPLQYIPNMLAAASRVIQPSAGVVTLDFDELGTWDDLTEGYHYGAKLEGGGQVDLPWEGGQSDAGLKNDAEGRYYAWLKVFAGETWHGLDYSGSWSETINARLDIWGDKAPQWLLLQYGQEEWEPTIAPYPIVENITTQVQSLFTFLLEREVREIVGRINRKR